MSESTKDFSGSSMNPERMFQLGIQMEEARRRMVEMIASLSERISLAEHINTEDVERWNAEFFRARSLMEYEKEGEQAEFLQCVKFDLDIYNQLCEGIQGVFDKFSGEGKFPKEDVMWRLESMKDLLKKRFIQVARV